VGRIGNRNLLRLMRLAQDFQLRYPGILQLSDSCSRKGLAIRAGNEPKWASSPAQELPLPMIPTRPPQPLLLRRDATTVSP
jgi:hypothetical protein